MSVVKSKRKASSFEVFTHYYKMRKLSPKMNTKEFHDWVFSWIKSHRKYMSKKQYEVMMDLYNQEVKKCKDQGQS